MRPTSLLPLAVLLAVASAPPTSQLQVPVGGVVVDPCIGQLVTFTGTGHFTTHVTANANNLILDGHFNASNIKGVGTDGTNYVGSEADNQHLHLNFNNAGAEETIVQTFHVTSQGKADNFVLHSLLHITVNANGDVTAVVDNLTAECRG